MDSSNSFRTHSVAYGGSFSQPAATNFGVPQGSVLGPLLFILYTSDLAHIVLTHGLQVNMYADDIQVYGFCTPAKMKELSSQLETCLDSLNAWFSSNRLQLNVTKTEFMWFASSRRQRSVAFDPVRFDSHLSSPVPRVKCLGVVLDSELSFTTQVSMTVSAWFSVLRQRRSV